MALWTATEEKTLGLMYFRDGLTIEQCMIDFPHRTYESIRHKTERMARYGDPLWEYYRQERLRGNPQSLTGKYQAQNEPVCRPLGRPPYPAVPNDTPQSPVVPYCPTEPSFSHVAAAQSPEVEEDLAGYISQLESQVATLRTQLTWAQQADSAIREGGLITHRESDVHYADANHLLSSCEQTWTKALEVFRQYKPNRIQLVWGDDYVAGRGIYKNQDLDTTVSNAEQQCQVGAVHFMRRMQSLRAITDAPISVIWLRGNHEYSNGHPLAAALFLMVKDICSGFANVEYKLGLDASVVNLAYEGTHNALFLHGYGHSSISPNSPRFISDVKDRLLVMHRNMLPHEQIWRVASGHTHMYSKDLERTIGLKWDTTGGWQRNARVQLGFNQRPSGSIMYVSLPGMDGDILEPIGVRPDFDVYRREIEDAHLGARNMEDTAECLRQYVQIQQDRGARSPAGILGTLADGRW